MRSCSYRTARGVVRVMDSAKSAAMLLIPVALLEVGAIFGALCDSKLMLVSRLAAAESPLAESNPAQTQCGIAATQPGATAPGSGSLPLVARFLAEKTTLSPLAVQKTDSLRLVFITCCKDAAFFGPVKKGMQDAAQAFHVTCDWRGTEDVDLDAQVQLVQQAVETGYDGIALNIIDPQAFDAVIQRAMEREIPVVAFNVDDHATPNLRLSAVSQRLYEAGQRLAEQVSDSIPDGSHVLLTRHDEGVSALEDRRRGQQDALKDKGLRWTILTTGSDPQKAVERIAETLRQHSEIRIVLGTGQSDTEAAGHAIEQHFPDRGYWAAGFDLSPETLRLIQQGSIRCTVDQQPYIQGYYPVVQLTLYLRYGILPSNIDAGATIIDRRNVERVIELTEDGYR